MVCCPCQAAGNQSYTAYGRRITGEVTTYRERQKGLGYYRECGEEMEAVSMESRMMTQHGRVAEVQQSWKTLATRKELQKYRMAFLAKGGPLSLPVEGCPGRAATRTVIRIHFLHRNILYTMVILEEGNLPHPRCTRCDMLLPRRSLNGSYPATDQCARGAKRRRLAASSGGGAEGELEEGL